MKRQSLWFIGAVIVATIFGVGVWFVFESNNEEEATTICTEQGYTPFKIKQYGRTSIWLCVDEDGVLRVPKKKEF